MTAAPLAASGKVLDGSAVLAWATGSLAMAAWAEVAWQEQLVLEVPGVAPREALLAEPHASGSIAYLLTVPEVVLRDEPDDSLRVAINARRTEDGTFDPLASWVTGTARARGWSVLTSDPDRLRRLDPGVEVDVV